MKQLVKKLIAREVIMLIVAITSILVIWSSVLVLQSFKTDQIEKKISKQQSLIDSLKQVDFNRTLLFYFSEVEEKTFLDRLYQDYQNTHFKNTPSFSALIDTMKEYNGIIMSSFDFLLMDQSEKPYYLRDLKYAGFEEKVKNSLSIYDQNIPEQVSSRISERKADENFSTSHIDRFWLEAKNSPDFVFKKLTKSYRKYFGFSSTTDLISFLERNDDTSYRKSIEDSRADINELKENLKFWTGYSSLQILFYVSIGIFGLLYVIRGLWVLLRWAIKNSK